MELTTNLNDHEIREAIKEYVEKHLDAKVEKLSDVSIHMHKAYGNDPRERDYVTASAKYKK